MSDNCRMTYAIDLRDMKRKTPDEVYIEYTEKHFPLVCELCKGLVHPKCGNIREHHFAHNKTDNPNEQQIICREGSGGGGTGPSKWHRDFQGLFPIEMREQRRMNNGCVRKADILLSHHPVVIEFQKGEFGGRFEKNTCINRNTFWNGMGDKIVWLFQDTVPKTKNITISVEDTCFRLYTPYLRSLFGDNDFDPEKIEVHLMYEGEAYYLYGFKDIGDNITEASFCRSFFNDFLEYLKVDPVEVLPGIEEMVISGMKEMHELVKEPESGSESEGGKKMDNAVNNGVKTLREISREVSEEGCDVFIAVNNVTGIKVKMSASAYKYSTMRGYIQKPGYTKFMESSLNISYADTAQWTLEWKLKKNVA